MILGETTDGGGRTKELKGEDVQQTLVGSRLGSKWINR